MIRNDITKVEAEAIVNPANEALLEGSGTSRAIYLAAGERKLASACKRIGHCDLGKAVITKAYQLPSKYIIHGVGPVWIDGKHDEEKYLYSAYKESLLLAKKHRLKSIAFPLLSSGNDGYPKDLALKVAIRAISDFLLENEMLVYLVLYDREAVILSQKLFAEVKEYIDDHYVEEHDAVYSPFEKNRFASHLDNEEFIPLMRAPSKTHFDAGSSIPPDRTEKTISGANEELDSQPLPSIKLTRSLDDLINHMDETFSQMLLRLIDERGLKDAYVYKKANIDRRHFAKIRKDVNYAPNKKTVLAFAIALELSLGETKDLLMRAGFALSRSSKFDVIICYFIENHHYDIFEINEMLFAYEQPILGG